MEKGAMSNVPRREELKGNQRALPTYYLPPTPKGSSYRNANQPGNAPPQI